MDVARKSLIATNFLHCFLLQNPIFVPMTLEIIISEVLKLGKRERLELVQIALESIAREEDNAESDGLTEEQGKEIDRRLARFNSGQVKTIPGDMAFAEIAQKYGLQLPIAPRS